MQHHQLVTVPWLFLKKSPSSFITGTGIINLFVILALQVLDDLIKDESFLNS